MRQNAEPLLFEDDEETYARDEASPASGPSHITFSKVMRQQAAIVQQLGRGDVATAARFVDQLITLQTDNGGPEFAAKSLCSLAQSAKALGNDELHYEWSTRAAEINPSDTRATGQAADACIRMEHFDEALRLLSLTETYGDPLFARLGRARILRAQGNLDGALAAFQTLEKEFAGNAEVSYAWAGHAEVLREMWCLDEALATYRLGSELDQEALFLKCGVGAVLTDMGLLAEAEKVYASVLAHDGERHVAQNGKATVLREMGDLPAALVEFERCIEKFPGNVVAYCGRADVLRLSGKISEALEAYQEAAKRFPFEATPYLGSADILRENGQLDEALQVYEAGIARFPRKPRMFIGRAYVLKYQHKTEASLQAFDKVTQKFPYELGGLLGRADLLKEMGKLDEALEFYDKVIDRWSMHPYARNAKASILAVGKRYAEAEALLTTGIPQTEADWSAVHLRGMILLRKGEIQKALDHFTKAMLQTPYARHRKLFAKSCAVARLRLQQYVEAETSVRDPQEPVADVIAMHVMAATGQSEPAIRQLIKIRKNAFAPVIGIAEEIASQYRLHSVPARHDFDWIYDREIEALMLQAAFLPVGGQGRFLHN
jgi:tetratricopeptide (TPR) repeat protein